jgi:hypothetical protein
MRCEVLTVVFNVVEGLLERDAVVGKAVQSVQHEGTLTQ